MYKINFTRSLSQILNQIDKNEIKIVNLSQIVDQNNTCVYLFHNFCQK